MRNKFLVFIIFTLFGLNILAQTNVNFEFSNRYNCEIKSANINLKNKDKQIVLFNDTLSEFKKDFTIPAESANYIISVELEYKNAESKKRKRRRKGELDCNRIHSQEYPFELLGNEIDVFIDVSFSKRVYSDSLDGSIGVVRHYNSVHDIEIEYAKDIRSNESIREPFFILKNNSNDTLYGQHIKTLYWGWISYMIDDSTWTNNFFGNLDYNFSGGTLLIPGAATIATVGSFGWTEELPKKKYRYTLLYTTDVNSTGGGYRKQVERDNIAWFVKDFRFYKLVYEFEVK